MDTAYEKKLADCFSAACVQMSFQLAKNVGIIKILLSAEHPLTSTEIAEQGNLKERYVRELLGALSASEIIVVDKSSKKYHIPKGHKDIIRKEATYTTLVTLMSHRMERLKDVFSKDGPEGIHYDEPAYAAIEERRTITQDSIIDDDILPCLPEIKKQLEEGTEVAEFGCAQATILLNLAQRFPKTTFLGCDISDMCLEKARKTASERKLTNVTFENHDVMELPDSFSNRYDWIFLRDTIHDLPYPAKAMRCVKKALKENGTASFLDFGMQGTLTDHIGSTLWAKMYTLSTFFCLPEGYRGEDVEAYGPCWNVETVKQLMKDSGFTDVKAVVSERSSSAVHYICK